MKPKNNKDRSNKISSYARYSGIGFQMFLIIALGIWGGMKLNAYLGYEKPVITAVAAMLSIFVSMYYVYRQVRK